MSKERIGVLTSGGDCPGLNAVLRGVARAAHNLNWEVIGFKDGFEGLLPPGNSVVLDRTNTAGIMHLGGTMIGTTNRGHFVAKVGEGNVVQVDPSVIDLAKETFN
jgi:6-phosphofructokinase 1